MKGIEINKKIVLINSASSTFVLIINFSVLIWLQQYLLKHISAEEYSLVPIVMSVIAMMPLLTTVLTGGLSRYLAIASAKGDENEVERICSTMFPVLLLFGVTLFVVGCYVSWHIDEYLVIAKPYVNDARIMLLLMFSLTAIRLPLTVFLSGFMVRQKLMWQDMIDLFCQFLRIALLFILLLNFSPRALWVTVALVTSEFIKLAISVPVSIKLLPAQKVRRGLFKKQLAGEITRFGSWWLVGNMADVLKKNMDTIILNRFAGAVDVTVFYVSGIAFRAVDQLLMPITKPFIPVLTALVANHDYTRLSNTYTRTARYHSWVVIMISVPAMLFSNEVMHLYLHGKYDQAGIVMMILLGAAIVNAQNALGSAIALATGDMRGLSLRGIVVQACNLLLTVLFVVYMHMGAYGSAMATLLAALFIETTVKWPFCWKISHTSFKKWFTEVFCPSVLPAIPSILFCSMVKEFFSIDDWLKLLTVSFISALIYIIMIMRYGIRQQDKVDINRLADKCSGTMAVALKYIAKFK